MDTGVPSGFGSVSQAAPTAPESAEKGIAVAYQFVSGIAPGNASELFLLVDRAWRFLRNPDFATVYSVQDAFCGCSDRLQIEVHYKREEIVAVKVMTK